MPIAKTKNSEDIIHILKERDKHLRKKVQDMKNQDMKKSKQVSSSLIEVKSQLSKIKWMLQIYQNSAISKKDEHYNDFEKLHDAVNNLHDDVQNLIRET
ncbi:hypothetical protein CL632_01320 [bacterium]|jgi:hypothetical protein|nr:hypothetical protein [bacterium]MDP6571663.1 hypothetical protein [Patescibacteria group bacterium]MDP6756239.1 hypothetical protein [Patescibacteria group bacterium]|tara:strand:+ start:4824 stop:5120 length:297 start_codon:yes stop_codon:yes gene_type:complete